MMTKRAASAPAQGNNQNLFSLYLCVCVCVCFPRCFFFFLLTNEPLSVCDAPEFSFSLRQLLLMRLFITELLYYYYYKNTSSFGVIL